MAIWKNVKGFEGLYMVSNEGQIKSLANRFKRKDGRWYEKKEKIIKTYINTHGYPSLSLCKDGVVYKKAVHRIVAEAFIPNPENKPEIDHKDGNRENSNVNNLHWVTHQENMSQPLFLSKRSGTGNPMYGRCGKSHPNAVKIKNVTTGKIYGAIVEAAADLKVAANSIYLAIKEKRPCKGFYFDYLKTESEE